MRKGCTARSSSRGFTLLEVLVAMTLVALLAGFLAGGLKLGSHAWSTTEHLADDLDAIEGTRRFLKSHLTASYPMVLPGSDDAHTTIAFEGRSDSIEFTAELPRTYTAGGLYRIKLSSLPDEDRPELTLYWQVERGQPLGAADHAWHQQRRLLGSGTRLHVSYYGATDEQPAIWHKTWSGHMQLPELIRIEIAFAANTPYVWPELVIAPKLNVDALCSFNLVTQRCRGRGA